MSSEVCLCGSEKLFADCCQPIISGKKRAPSPEAVMRARYTSYAVGDIDYIITSQTPDEQESLSKEMLARWSQSLQWTGLEIIRSDVSKTGERGEVEFKAYYRDKKKLTRTVHHEVAQFLSLDGVWYFKDGVEVKEPIVNSGKVGRNSPCPCGSGKKYKKCCG